MLIEIQDDPVVALSKDVGGCDEKEWLTETNLSFQLRRRMRRVTPTYAGAGVLEHAITNCLILHVVRFTGGTRVPDIPCIRIRVRAMHTIPEGV